MTIVLKKSLGAEKLKQLVHDAKQTRGFDAHKHCGVIRLTVDPLAFQQRIRDEWH